MNEEKRAEQIAAAKKNKKIIFIVFGITVAILVVLSVIVGILQKSDTGPDVETWGTVDPSLLHETKDEDFDIMEYDAYLSLNRTITYFESNMTVSVDDSTVSSYDEGFQLMYELVKCMIAGDNEGYNFYVYPKDEQEEPFTQQQIYDVVLTRQSYTQKQGESGSYTEIVYKLEYKIHENNGTFRNDIEPDASRPQYFVINNSMGDMMVMDIVETGYLK